MMGFQSDIFISYAHIDNLPLTPEQEGWISEFHQNLETRLAQLLGERPKIWRDFKLQGNDYFADAIVEQFPKVALLVSILSPRYVKSEWCIKELKAFYKAAAQTGGVRVAGNKARVFKVIKTPIPHEQHPEELQTVLGYDFYKVDQSGIAREFNKILYPELEIQYWRKLDDLACEIRELLGLLKPFQDEAVQPQSTSKTVIYLAETSSDLNPERDTLKRELKQYGHVVLPDQELTHTPDCAEVVAQYLDQCQLSIHLIGARCGFVPEGSEQSVVELQHSLAQAQAQQRSEFTSLIWLPPDLQVQEARQAKFIQALQNDAELLQTSLEELKTLIQTRLHPPIQLVDSTQAEGGCVRVYLICDQRDQTEIEPLENALWDQGFEVLPSLFEGDASEVRQYHQDCLRDCDAVMIYYGQGNEVWLYTKLRELQKASGYGRSKPLCAKAVYVAAPHTAHKQRFRTQEAAVIKSSGVFEPDVLKPFLTAIAQAQGGSR